ncbi:MAG: YitT family protein [Ruthenibacterium sp.]
MKVTNPIKFTKPTAGAVKLFCIDRLYDVAGSILFSIGIYTFAKSAHFAPGGVSGLALILNHLWPVLPIGVVTLVLNVPIVVVSFRVVGKTFLYKSFCTMLISTFFMDFVFPCLPLYVGSSLLAALFAGVFSGAGLALVYMRGSSTGGTDFLNLSIKKLHPHLSIGQVTLVTDCVVILLGGLVYGNIDAVLYGVISTYAGTTVIDKIMYGAGSGKLAIIITQDGHETARRIADTIGRGATLVRAIGTYSGVQRHMLLCVTARNEVFKVRDLAHEVDSTSFVMITEASEIFGEGFTETEKKR